MLNNNGIPGLNMAGINMGGMGSIFDPLPTGTMAMQLNQLPVKKEEKPMSMSQPQITHKAMDGELDFGGAFIFPSFLFFFFLIFLPS